MRQIGGGVDDQERVAQHPRHADKRKRQPEPPWGGGLPRRVDEYGEHPHQEERGEPDDHIPQQPVNPTEKRFPRNIRWRTLWLRRQVIRIFHGTNLTFQHPNRQCRISASTISSAINTPTMISSPSTR